MSWGSCFCDQTKPNIFYIFYNSTYSYIYLGSEQYVGSAVNFEKRFRKQKSDINSKKDRCRVDRHFPNKCRDKQNYHVSLKIEPIEQVSVKEESKLDHLGLKPFGTEKNVGKSIYPT